MKKLLLITSLIFLIFTACKKEDVSAKTSVSLTGKWRPTQTITTNYTVSPASKTVVNLTNQNDYLLFRIDGTGEVSTNNGTLPMKYTYSDPALVITYNSLPNVPYNYQVSQLTTSNIILIETKKDNTGKTTETYEVSYSKL